MLILKGKGVFGGIAIGTLSFLKKDEPMIKRYHIEDPAQETLRFYQARDEAVSQLGGLYDKAVKEVGESGAMVFDIHQMMLQDPDYCESVENIIRTQKVNAEYAVGITADNFAQMFSSMDDAYMRERAVDVRDISERVVRVLADQNETKAAHDQPVVIAAQELTPSETVQLDKRLVKGFVTVGGSANSHTAILARTMNIPAIVGVAGLRSAYDAKTVILDGFDGLVYIDPDDETMRRMQDRLADELEKKKLLEEQRGQETRTLDGRSIKLYANIGSVGDVGEVLHNDAGGIGLFRSEFLYLEQTYYPSEDYQFAVYKQVAQNMAGKPVIIRTLDIGADKQAGYFELPEEENPAMGYRAIRICLNRPEIFKAQLRAIYRASAFGNVSLMIPMITSVREVRQVKKIIGEVKQELRSENIPFSEDVQLGIMIETPATALISDLLAQEVDFFSIGTNDLTQYTLAIDRQNQQLEDFYDPHHPALLRLIRLVIENAHAHGIWAGICGELAADAELTETFLKMGVDELSVSPPFILPLRKKIRESDVSLLAERMI